MKRKSTVFLLLVFAQALHSIEEYIGRLWEIFPPATFLCGLVSDDLHFGFLVINIGLFVLGILFWLFLVKPDRLGAYLVIWFWIVIELTNGVIHPIWSIMERSYTPGVITAPLLFVLALYLLQLTRKNE